MKKYFALIGAMICTAALFSCEGGGIFGALFGKEESSISVIYTSGDDSSYDSVEEEGEPIYYIDENGDLEWAEKSAPVFNVSTAEQLAGVVRYVNTEYTCGQELTINLMNDIYLTNWMWEPMGCIDADGTDRRFNGTFNGNEHYIYDMKIWYSSGGYYGFIGQADNLTLNCCCIMAADIKAKGGFAGAICAKADGVGKCEGIYVSGDIHGIDKYKSGTFFGSAPYMEIVSAGSDLNLDDVKGEHASREDFIAKYHDPRFYEIEVDNDQRIIKFINPAEFSSPQWVVRHNGGEVYRGDLQGNEPLTFVSDIFEDSGEYKVFIEAEEDGYRLQCSNVCSLYFAEKPYYPLSIGEDERKRIICTEPDKISEVNYVNLCWIMEYEGTRVFTLTYSGNEEFHLLRAMMNSGTVEKSGTFKVYLADADDNDIEQVSNSISYSVNVQE